MTSETIFGCCDESAKNEDESFDNVDHKAQVFKMSLEIESYKQELYGLHRKLETNETMLTELSEQNEFLERSLTEYKATMDRKNHEVEKHNARIKELEDSLMDVETKLANKTKENKELHATIEISNDKLSQLMQVAEISIRTEDDSGVLKLQNIELTERLMQELENCKQLEETVRSLESQSSEYRDILMETKKQLIEKNEILESTKEELALCNAELQSLKIKPATEICKGNSLFAEVEDRRKMTLEKMTAMRNSYLEAKRSFQAQEAEIKALKAERAAMLQKWKNDTVETIQQNANLLDKYKGRIAELERKLKHEENKQKQTTKNQQIPENCFPYLQSLIAEKKKEIEELHTKIESDSVKALLEEEMKCKIAKQLRYWRYRAMSGEAELLEIKNRLETNPSSTNAQILETIKSRVNVESFERNESLRDETSCLHSIYEPAVVNETVITLESLMTIPKLPIEAVTDVALSSIDSTYDFTETSAGNNDSVVSMDLTEIVTGFMGIGNEKSSQSSKSGIMLDSQKTCDLLKKTEELKHEDLNLETKKNNEKSTDVGIMLPPTLKSAFPKPNEPSKSGIMLDSPKTCDPLTETEDVKLKTEKNNEKSIDSSILLAPILKSVIAKPNESLHTTLLCNESKERGKKTLRFATDTIDPPSKSLKKQPVSQPKYPIIFISSKSSLKK